MTTLQNVAKEMFGGKSAPSTITNDIMAYFVYGAIGAFTPRSR